MKNKKAQIAGSLTDFYAYAFFVLALIIFLILFFIVADRPAVSNDMPSEMSSIDASTSLTSFLRAQTTQGKTMAELIIDSQRLPFNERADMLSKEAELILNPKKTTEADIFLVLVTYPLNEDSKIDQLVIKRTTRAEKAYAGTAEIELPSIDMKTLKVRLFLWSSSK